MTHKLNPLQGLASMDGDGCRAACLEAVSQARQTAQQKFGANTPVAQVLKGLSDRFDALLGALFQRTQIDPTILLAVVAQGGYGRRELFPFSDLDLLFIHQGDDAEVAQRLVQNMVYPLWDAKVSVGYAVRTVEETLELASHDLSACTALLDGRVVAGDPGPFHSLSAAGLREFFGPESQAFFGLLQKERAGRHQRFGQTVYLLEPNVKLGKGGLRDLSSGLWAAKARLGVNDLGEVAAAGGATSRQVRALLDAREFLYRLRLAMHFEAQRAQDHLIFELQETLGPQLFPEPTVPGRRRRSPVGPAVERLMHAYYRTARTVVLETEGILERCQRRPSSPEPQAQPVSYHPQEHLVLAENHLRSKDPQRFWEVPADLLRVFALALEHGAVLDRSTRDAVAEAVAGDPGAQLLADPNAAETLLEILAHPEQSGAGTVLEEMHHLGILAAMIPEFEPCTGRVQHDIYHVYTVDVHTLYVVELLKAWRRKEQQEQHPTAVAVMERVDQPQTLFLAALLHDVAKPLGSGHAEKGARIAAGVAARLGLSSAQVQQVALLVREHLTMAHLSQRRDLSDPRVIRLLAEKVSSTQCLRQLYLLTLADTARTAPENLTQWKGSLLEELYIKTYLSLKHGDSSATQSQSAHLAEKREALELVLKRRISGQAAELAQRVPSALLASFPVEELVGHLGVAHALESERPSSSLQTQVRHQGPGLAELTVCCWDGPGRLAAITGVLLAHGIEVLAAQVFTLQPASGPRSEPPRSLVLDVFTVRPHGREDSAWWETFTQDLRAVLAAPDGPEAHALSQTVRRHLQPSGLPPRVVPRVPVAVSVDNGISDAFTVLDVQAPDRPGVLYTITRTLSDLGVAIHLSKVATEAGRVVDIFYIAEEDSGAKIVQPERLQAIRRAVIQGLSPSEK